MLGSVSASRRATAFAQALEERQLAETPAETTADHETPGAALPTRATTPPEGPTSDTGTPPADGEADTERELLLSLAEELCELPRPELDQEVKTVQRAQLLAAMETACAEDGTPENAHIPHQRTTHCTRPGRSGSHRAPSLGPLAKLLPNSRLSKGIAASGLGFGVAASAFGGLAAASTDALPGDSLYGLKRGMEDLRLDLACDDADRGRLYLDHAATRIQEVRRLLERERAGDLDDESLGEVRRALSGVHHSASEGHRLLSQAYRRDGDIARIELLSTFADNHRSGWSELRNRLPLQLTDVGDEVSSVLDSLKGATTPLAQHLPDTPRPEGRPEAETDGLPERPDPPRPRASSAEGPTGPAGHGGTEPPMPSDTEEHDRDLLDEGLLGPSSKDRPAPDRDSLLTPHGAAEPGRHPTGEDVSVPPMLGDVTGPLGLDDEEWQ